MSANDLPIVEAIGLTKRYGKQEALRGLGFSVKPGEVFGLIGPDGAGKSSILKAVAGVLSFDGGSLTVLGHTLDSDRAAEAIKANIGLMPQGLGQNLYPELSVEENVDFFARLRLVPQATATERKERLFAITRLSAFRSRPMKQLSGGMKQKLGLVCTLIHAPKLIILDEPTTGVDPVSRRDFWVILAELLHETQATALISTAYLDEASRFDRVLLMHEGRALALDTPEQLVRSKPGCVLMLSGLTPAERQSITSEVGYLEPRGQVWRLYVAGVNAEEARTSMRSRLGRDVVVSAAAPELEDIFIAAIGRDAPPLPPVIETQHGDAKPLIEARGLCKSFGDFRAVIDANFRVMPGEVFGLLGANGAGKTTAIKMLTGITQPSGGEGWVAGADMRRAGRDIKAHIGYMSQAFSLYTDLTARENILLYASIYGLDREQTAKRLAWVVEMAELGGFENALAASLPMGLRQRLALGCALIHSPKVLFLDEPTSGVDPLGRRRFWDILFRLAREDGVAILVTTHYMSEAERCDNLALMYAGRVVADGAPQALKAALEARRGRLLSVETNDAHAAYRLYREAGIDVSLFGRVLHCFTHDVTATTRQIESMAVAQGWARPACSLATPSMEDVFVALMTELEQVS